MTLTDYWWLLIWLFTGGVFLAFLFPKREEVVLGKTEVRWDVLPAILMVIPYIIWAGYRSDVYGDTYAYRTAFQNAPTTFGEILSYVGEATKDRGFSALTVFLKNVFGSSDVIYFLIIAAIQMLIIALVFRKYSCNYWLSIFFFIASNEYMSWAHNGIRQFLGLTLIMAGTEFLLRKKYVPLVCLILIASTLHASLLLMLPVVFIVQGKAWNKKTVLCIVASVLVLGFTSQFTDILDRMMENTQYANMVTDWKEWQDDGMNPIRLLVYSVPMLFSIIGYRQIKETNNPIINVMVNFSILTFAISICATATSGIFIGRLCSLGLEYSLGILLPWEIKNLFTAESSRFVTVSAVVFFCVFFYYQMHYSWALI